MSSLDPTVARILDSKATDSDDEDALIASLEEDEELSSFREQRLQQLHAEVSRARDMRNSGSGSYLEIKDEKSIMDITTSTNLAIVHFFKPDFGRCSVIDRHLENLAPKHFDTRFLKINVENAPFLVTKLKVQVLPCVICFVGGVGVDRILGFEGLGNGDRFTTGDLESRLLACGVLVRAKAEGDRSRFEVRHGKQNQLRGEDDTDDDD